MDAHDQTGVASAIIGAGVAVFLGSLPLIYCTGPMNRLYGIGLGDAYSLNSAGTTSMPTAADGAAWWSWPIVLTGVVGLVLPSRFASIYVPIATVATLAIALIPVVQIMRWINATKKT